MKKKNKYRILSFLFCFMFLFFVGCDGGPGGGTEGSPRSLDGVKVLSKPADYNFSEAVGKYASQYYYNLFAGQILKQLYNTYEELTIDNEDKELMSFFGKENDLENFYINKKVNNVGGIETITYEKNNSTFYFYDSLRYTIKTIETKRVKNPDGTAGDIIEQKLSLDLNSGWNWNIKYNSTGVGIKDENDNIIPNTFSIFYILNNPNDTIKVTESTNKQNLNVMFDENYYDLFTSWKEIYNMLGARQSDFSNIYSPDNSKVEIVDGVEVKKYNISPYIQKEVLQQANITAMNYYEDALEYAIYLFVLGYDYVDAKGVPTADATLFDFTIEYTNDVAGGNVGLVKDVKVGGWENQPISIVDALGRVKSLYKELGNYIGVTSTNKEQIKRFVMDKIIGTNAVASDKFAVSELNYVVDTATPDIKENDTANPNNTLNFDRHYETIVGNLIDYACKKAPIGWDTANNQAIGLDNAYLTSQITDYKGDYFFLSYEDEDDSNVFQYIDAAEYQSMVLYPQLVDLGKPLTDLWLAFEYYDDPNPDAGLVFADSLTINVGFRYFNSATGEYSFMGEGQIKVDYGKDGSFAGEDPDKHWFYVCDFSDVADVFLDKDVVINTRFNNNIGNGAINPFAGDSSIDEKKSKLITGYDSAREYYKLNDSSSYGSYGTLNEKMFAVSKAGEQGCDFMEVYFDTVKQKGVSGINYNFKVGLVTYLTEEEV